MENWEKHFLELLEVEKRIDKETGEKRRLKGDLEEELGNRISIKEGKKEKKRQGLMAS